MVRLLRVTIYESKFNYKPKPNLENKMNQIDLKRFGTMMTVIIIFLLGSILSCEDNQNRGINRGRYYDSSYGYRSTSPTYTNPQRGDYSTRSSNVNGGGGYYYQNYGGVNADPRSGQYGDVSGTTADPRGDRSSSSGNWPGGSSGGLKKGKQVGTPSTPEFPYVINGSDLWEGSCEGETTDSDSDGICDTYEIDNHKGFALHPDARNGFKVGGREFESDKTIAQVIKEEQNVKRAMVRLFETDYTRKLETLIGNGGNSEVGVITGGWGEQPTNWGTEVQSQFKKQGASLPSQEDIGFGDMDVPNSLLLKSGKTINKIAGFASDPFVTNKYIVCTEAWFRKPLNSKGTSFRIENAETFADDGAFILADNQLVAYSFRANPKGFWGNFAKFFTGTKGGNDLEHVVKDTKFHLMDFCFVNEKKIGQGEVRYWRNIGDKTYGYEPLSPIDFRVTKPSDVDVSGSIHELLPLDLGDAQPSYDPSLGGEEPTIPTTLPPSGGTPGGGGGSGGLGNQAQSINDMKAKLEEMETQFWNDWAKQMLDLIKTAEMVAPDVDKVITYDGLKVVISNGDKNGAIDETQNLLDYLQQEKSAQEPNPTMEKVLSGVKKLIDEKKSDIQKMDDLKRDLEARKNKSK